MPKGKFVVEEDESSSPTLTSVGMSTASFFTTAIDPISNGTNGDNVDVDLICNDVHLEVFLIKLFFFFTSFFQYKQCRKNIPYVRVHI